MKRDSGGCSMVIIKFLRTIIVID